MKKVLIAILLLGLLPHASADYIHWVDFRLSAPVLRSALELDMTSQGGEQPLTGSIFWRWQRHGAAERV